MTENAQNWSLQEINCPVCNGHDAKVLGIRGNREYVGADMNVEPHVVTNVVECKTCHFIYTNPMICGMEHLEKEHYNNPKSYQSDEKGIIPVMFERRLQYLNSFVKGRSLLDVGAGKGEFLSIAKRQGWQVSGIEPSPEFCNYAKQELGIEIKQGFLNENTFPHNAYDAIALNHVLEHVDEPHKFLALFPLYLNQGGVLFIEVPNSDSPLMRLADLFFRFKGVKWSSRLSPLHPPFHKYGYSKRSLTYLLQKAGFEVIGVKTFPEADRRVRGNTSLLYKVRNMVSSVINSFGQGELLAVVAKRAKTN